MKHLASAKIGYSVHFIPLHTMSFYKEHFTQPPGRLAVTERVAEQLLSLPLFPGMADGDIDRVCDAVAGAFSRR
jgi:dTDP-4-amino-4,6-dideoxygalactose transaminase